MFRAAGQVRLGDGPGEPVIPRLSAREDEQVFIGVAAQGQFGSEDGGQSRALGGLGESGGSVESIGVRQSEPRQSQSYRLGDEPFGR